MGRRALGGFDTSYYHVVSRVAGQEMLLGDVEKEGFRTWMRRVERFSGVRCLAYCLMTNHFHLLLEVSEFERRRFDCEATASEIAERMRSISSECKVAQWLEHHDELVARGDEEGAFRWRQAVTRRMYSLPEFMKALKQGFSRWFNRRSGRVGTLWEGRYRSVLVEGSDAVLPVIAAYIDLNPVRAGLVRDPGEYRYSGYGEAVAGVRGALEHVARLMDPGMRGGRCHRSAALTAYRLVLFGLGEEGLEEARAGETPTKAVRRRGIDRERVEAVLKTGGRLTLREALHCRVRYFTGGFAVGSEGFVADVFERCRPFFGAGRERGPRRMRWADWGQLRCLRDLRVDAVRTSTSPGSG